MNAIKKWDKWNYQAHLLGDISPEVYGMFKNAVKHKVYSVESEAWTEFEKEIIPRVIEASNMALKKTGLEPINIDNEQVIILSDETFNSTITNNTGVNASGVYIYGYIYLVRELEPVLYLLRIAHELAHASSYLELLIEEDFTIRRIKMVKSGIYNTLLQCYEGLNEAITDIWSKVILLELSNLYPKYKNMVAQALNLFCYGYQVYFFNAICNSYNLLDDYLIIKAYFTGESIDEMIDEIGSYGEILRTMTRNRESLFMSLREANEIELLNYMRNNLRSLT